MADQTHLQLLKEGVATWNQWRIDNPKVSPNLREAELRQQKLDGANLSDADLWGAQLYKASLNDANLRRADLRRSHLGSASLQRADLTDAMIAEAHVGMANFRGAVLTQALMGYSDFNNARFEEAILIGAHLANAELTDASLANVNLSDANLVGASLQRANLTGATLKNASLAHADLKYASLAKADLSNALLLGTILVETDVSSAKMTGCRVYGVSAWGLKGEPREQSNLVITNSLEPLITVDNIEVAQFVYLLLHNQKIRSIIDTITTKLVLILGRFTSERKKVLDALREQLRTRNYVPVLFDFDKPSTRDITETVSTLAHMSRFVIADLTEAKSIPQELERIVPDLPSLAVQPILLASDSEYAMFEHFRRFPWVLETYIYSSTEDLLKDLEQKVILQAEAKARELLSQ